MEVSALMVYDAVILSEHRYAAGGAGASAICITAGSGRKPLSCIAGSRRTRRTPRSLTLRCAGHPHFSSLHSARLPCHLPRMDAGEGLRCLCV